MRLILTDNEGGGLDCWDELTADDIARLYKLWVDTNRVPDCVQAALGAEEEAATWDKWDKEGGK